MLRYAIMRGIREELRSYVMQSGAATLTELVNAARVAELAAPNEVSLQVDTTMIGQVLNEITASRRVAEKNAADLQRLTARFEATTVGSINRPEIPETRRRVTCSGESGNRSSPTQQYVSPRPPPRALSPGRRYSGRPTQRQQYAVNSTLSLIHISEPTRPY